MFIYCSHYFQSESKTANIKAITMNAVAALRSAKLNMLVNHGVEVDCTYEGQISSHIGRLLSVMFNGDHMADHALFLMLLNKEWATAKHFITLLKDNMDLLEYMVDYYICDQLKSEIRSFILEQKQIS
jgi:hypothetical protein